MAASYNSPPPGYKYIFVRWIRTKTGRVIYASSYNRRAFRILVPA